MPKKDSFSERIVKESGLVFVPLKKIKTLTQFSRLLKNLGWDLSEIEDVYNVFSSVIQKLDERGINVDDLVPPEHLN